MAEIYKIFTRTADPVTGLGAKHTVIKRVYPYPSKDGKKTLLSTNQKQAKSNIANLFTYRYKAMQRSIENAKD